MSYQVIARKWRPQSFEEVVGQNATEQTLRNAIAQNRIAHAYLFAGPRGVGKTTTARIFAKALNCVQGPTANPCNQCDSCREITAGNSIDVLEIDAASNRGIDEIRELRENVKYAPVRDRNKIFIIDEVHMLTTEAFNALLKTLEEPPDRVTFILATTELHKVPATILSRCQHFNFRAISHKEIFDRLSFICQQEQVQIDERALNAIVRASEGSMRDAQSLLDQIISFCGKEIDHAKVQDLLGIIPQQLLDEFAAAVAKNDPKQLLMQVESLVQSGRNLQHFVRELLAHFRNILMVKIAGEDSQLIPLTALDMAQVKTISGSFSEEDLTRFFTILVGTESELRWTSQPRFHLEMGLMKLVQAKRLASIEELLTALKEAGGPANERNLGAAPGSSSSSTLRPATASPARGGAQSASGSKELAEELRSQVAQRSPMVASLLEHAKVIQQTSEAIEIQFSNQSNFHCDMLQSAENLQLIKEVAESIAGKPLQVKVVRTNGQLESADDSRKKTDTEKQKQDLVERAKVDSKVKSFLDVFQGEITDVQELD